MKTKPPHYWYRRDGIELVQHFVLDWPLSDAYDMAMLSAESTQVGAVITNSRGKRISFGWNTVPKELRHIQEGRSQYAVHAEMMAVMGLPKIESLSFHEAGKCTVHIYGLAPCGNCLKHLLGRGLKKVHFFVAYDKPKWADNTTEFIKALYRRI